MIFPKVGEPDSKDQFPFEPPGRAGTEIPPVREPESRDWNPFRSEDRVEKKHLGSFWGGVADFCISSRAGWVAAYL